MSGLLHLAPIFLAFEVWQLVVAERYLGIRQMEQGIDPREQGPGEVTAFFWTVMIFVYWLWMGLLLAGDQARMQAVFLVLVSLIGFSLRRNCPLKWILVILTFEGAIRIGMLVSIVAGVWRRLAW